MTLAPVYRLRLRSLVRQLRHDPQRTPVAAPLSRWLAARNLLVQPGQAVPAILMLVELAFQDHGVAYDAVDMLRRLGQPESEEALQMIRRWGPTESIRFFAATRLEPPVAAARTTKMRLPIDEPPPAPVEVDNSVSPRGGISHLLKFDPAHPGHFPLLVLLLTTLAELLTVVSDPRLGLAVHIVLLMTLLYNALATEAASVRRLTLTLFLVPLIRLVSLGLPLASWPQVTWYFAASVPLFAAIALVIRQESWSRAALGLRIGNPILQALIALSGLGLGWLEYQILHPQAMVNDLSWSSVALPIAILTICTGLLEELLFRGLLQSAAISVLGSWRGVLLQAALFAVLHIGYASVVDVLFVLVVGLAFGIAVARTKSILGVTLAHALTNVMLFIYMPHWIG